MAHHLHREVEALKKKVLALSAMAEESVLRAVQAVEERDADLAAQVVKNDYVIDQAEVEVEEDCLKILALYQPVAIDLRFIIAVLKINGDLERIADLAVNIAERAEFLAASPPELSPSWSSIPCLSPDPRWPPAPSRQRRFPKTDSCW